MTKQRRSNILLRPNRTRTRGQAQRHSFLRLEPRMMLSADGLANTALQLQPTVCWGEVPTDCVSVTAENAEAGNDLTIERGDTGVALQGVAFPGTTNVPVHKKGKIIPKVPADLHEQVFGFMPTDMINRGDLFVPQRRKGFQPAIPSDLHKQVMDYVNKKEALPAELDSKKPMFATAIDAERDFYGPIVPDLPSKIQNRDAAFEVTTPVNDSDGDIYGPAIPDAPSDMQNHNTGFEVDSTKKNFEMEHIKALNEAANLF